MTPWVRRGLGPVAVLAAVMALAGGLEAKAQTPTGLSAAAQAVAVSDRFSVEVMGQGPRVLLIPGYASSREVWRPLAQSLSRDYEVHLVQLAGFAGEVWTHGDGPFLQPVVEALIDYAKGLDRPAVIGHSMGGLTGLMMAQQAPEALSRLMSVDSLPFFGAMQGPQVSVDQVVPMARQLATIVRTAPDDAFRQQQAITSVGMTRQAEQRQAIVDWSMTSDRAALGAAIYDIMTTDARGGLSGMTTPVWVIYAADEDGGAPAAMADSLWSSQYAPLPQVRLERVDGSRHFIMMDQPQAMERLARDFLKGDH